MPSLLIKQIHFFNCLNIYAFLKKEKHVYFHTNVGDECKKVEYKKCKKVQFMIEAILADHANLVPKKEHDLFCIHNTIKATIKFSSLI